MNRIICFEGLNRSGKGTQIGLLKTLFESLDYSVEVLRGDGSRPGIGSNTFYDPSSDWWKTWQDNPNKSMADWNSAYEVLTTENSIRSSYFFDENHFGHILMDRSYISRYFMLRQQGGSNSLEDIAINTQVIPDVYFCLEVPKDILLERVSDDDPLKTEFRRAIVMQWYDLWNEVVETAEDFLKDRFKRIDGTQSPELIHRYVKSEVLK